MDGYRDLYLPLSAGRYASSSYPAGYGVERRGSYSSARGESSHPIFAQAAVDAHRVYGAPAIYQAAEEYPYFFSPRRRTNPKRRPPVQSNGKQRAVISPSLTPKKKPFKKPQKGLKVTEAKSAAKAQGVLVKPQKSGGSTLAKETEDLHKLFRTGVDSGIKIANPKEAGGVLGKKRKADAKKRSALKKKGKANKKKLTKEQNQEAVKAEKAAEVAKAPLTEEEEKEIELALDLQRTAYKAFAEFFEIPAKVVGTVLEQAIEASAEADGDGDKANATTDEKKPEELSKPSPKPKLTPEMAKEIEEKALNFFSNMLAENDELSNLYLNKKDAGTFECPVCHSINPETSKRFTNVTGLVSHTRMRRQRRPEHRGFGKAICHIFGWVPLRPNRPIKQAIANKEDPEKLETEKVGEELEEKQEGAENI